METTKMDLNTALYIWRRNYSSSRGVDKVFFNTVEKCILNCIRKEEQSKNDGWILCSEKMPPERDSMFAKLKGTNRWRKTMFEKISDKVQVTIEDKNGKCVTTTANTVDGKWHCDLLVMRKDYKITAWQALAEPYREVD